MSLCDSGEGRFTFAYDSDQTIQEKLDAIVTDQSLPEEYDSFCQEHGIRVMTID